MTKTEVLRELKAMGTAQNRKVYPRHGVQGPMFGVSYANLGRLKKTIKADQALAEQLWATGNHDARILATMIAEPDVIGAKTLDAWARDLDNYVLTDAFSRVAGRTRWAKARAGKWMPARSEWKAAAGWNICPMLDEPDAYFEERLEAIEAGIHGAKNRVKHAMNQALIGIGVRNPGLMRKATAAARRIGRVDVDHGETGCKTQDAAAYIRKTVEHRKKRKK
ncbi:MAG: DNA alkylation repair protein [Planctomycetota bacterium]|jgi:3-methyladenine DNA glycosylase AlkD